MPEEKKENPRMKIRDIALDASQKYVNEFWKNYTDATKDYRKKLIRYYKQYRGKSDRKNYKGFADVFVNETLSACESITAQIFHTIYGEARQLRIVGKDETDAKKEGMIENLMLTLLDKMSDKKKILRNIRQEVSYGTTHAKICWEFEEKEMRFNKRADDGAIVKVTEKVVTKNQPELIWIDGLDIALDPLISDIENQKIVVWRKWMTDDEIREEVRNGRYSEKQWNKVKDAKPKEEKNEKKEKLKTFGIDYEYLEADKVRDVKNKNKRQVLEGWGYIPRWWVDDDININRTEAQELVLAVIETVGDVTVRMEECPYEHREIPFLEGHFIQADGEAFGIGVCEISENAQIELNDKRNQLLDHDTLQIFPPIIENKQAQIEAIKIAPNFRIKTNISPDASIKPYQIGGNFVETIQCTKDLKDEIRHGSGATNAVQGINNTKDSTAYEVSVLERRGSSRISLSTIDFGEKFLRRMYRLIFKMAQQFITKDVAIKMLGKEGVRWENVSPADIIGDYDFYPVITTDLESRAIVRNQLMQFYQSSVNVPNLNLNKIARKVYSTFGFNDIDEVIPPPQSETGQNDLDDEQELYVLSQGQKIDVKYFDNHIHKISILQQFLNQNQQKMSPQALEAVQDKIKQHAKYLETLQAALKTVPEAQQPTGNVAQPPQTA